MDYNALIAYAVGLVLLYLMARMLFLPIRLLLVLVYNGLIGGVLLWLVNLVGGYIGLHIGLNPVTALLAGFLGLPGIAALAAIRYLTS